MNSNIRLFSQDRHLFPQQPSTQLMGRCNRSIPFKATNISAMKFLMLRKSGQSFKKALNFATKRYCRYDNSQLRDGSRDFRVLKRRQVDNKQTHYGWAMLGQPDIVCGMPDIKQIKRNCQARDKLILAVMRARVQSSPQSSLNVSISNIQ